jgi:streptomycin 6-kinase
LLALPPRRSSLVTDLAERWALTVFDPFPATPGSPRNFVAPVTLQDGTPAVLKVSRFVTETRAEIAALRMWDGAGAARLLEADADLGALLLERVEPGTMLVEIDDDDAVRAACAVLRQLWRSAPDAGLTPLESWCAAYDRGRAALGSGASPDFPAKLFQRADELRQELLESTRDPVALHGDLHHFNVLRSNRADWLAIDPKGLVGDRCFDVCQYLRNPTRVATATNHHRLDIFSDELGLDRRRLAHWAVVHAVLDACWTYEDQRDVRPVVAYAEETLGY